MTLRRALFLSGKFGAGHDTLAEACASALNPHGVESKIVDCMAMLGGGPAAAGNWIFRRLLSMTPVYDGFHFSQLRANGSLGRFMERAAVRVMLPQLIEEVDAYRPDVIFSVFATGAAAAVELKRDRPNLVTVVFMTDSFAYGMWAKEGTDLFFVTSALAEASVRRYYPDAPVKVIEAPVRSSFYCAPDRQSARASLGIPPNVRCVLIMSGAWGIGPLDEIARVLALEGYWVLAVSGTNEQLAMRLAEVANDHGTVITFGYTDRVPELMAASDVVLTSSGDTCREARVLGLPIVLLDVVPGHGRENLIHELELGHAGVCLPTSASVLGNVRRLLDAAALERPQRTTSWGTDFLDELSRAGIALPQQ